MLLFVGEPPVEVVRTQAGPPEAHPRPVKHPRTLYGRRLALQRPILAP